VIVFEKRKTTIGYLLYIVSAVISGSLSLILIPIIDRKFGQAVYGRFTIEYNLILTSMSVAFSWINQSVLRYDNNSLRFKFRSIQLFIFVSIIYSILFIISFYFRTNSIGLYILVFIFSILFSISSFSINFLQSRFATKTPQLFEILRALFFVIILLFFVYSNLVSLEFIFLSLVFSFLFPIILILRKQVYFIYVVFVKTIRSQRSDLFTEIWNMFTYSFFKYGFVLSTWVALASGLNLADRVIINKILGEDLCGYYSSGYDLIQKSISLVMLPIILLSTPMLRQHWEKGYRLNFRVLIIKSIKIQVIIFVFFLLALYIFSDHLQNNGLVLLPFKSNFYIALGVLFFQNSVLLQKYLEFNGAQINMLLILLICFIANVGLNYFFIPIFGLNASPIITMITSLLYLFSILILVIRLNRYSLTQTQ
jgi:O-antigen/teichoic acid export membrane protein